MDVPTPGRFGPYGGRYVPETLMAALEELDRVHEAAKRDPTFWAELEALLKDYVGRPTPLTEAPRLAAIYALGLIQAEPKVSVPALEKLLAAKDPQTRRSAALGLGNVIGVAVAQEKKTRSLPAEFPANRQDLLSAAVLVTQAAPKGFDDPSPQVRGPCVDAVQQVSASLVDLIRDPFDPTKEYPPPGSILTAPVWKNHPRNGTPSRKKPSSAAMYGIAKNSESAPPATRSPSAT